MKFTIIGRKSCSWCRKARQLCKKNDHTYTYKDLDAPANASLRYWFEIENIKTVPQIFVLTDEGESKLVGGYEDLEKFLS